MIKKLMSAASAVVVTLGLVGVMQAPSAFATEHNEPEPGPEPKVFVCKYVGKPGVDERLQTGNNPISVSANSTSGAEVGAFFNDAQGRSFVLKIDNTTSGGQEGEPDVSECPPAQGGAPNTSVTGVCVPNEQVVKLTFVNKGNVASTVSVNGASSSVAVGATTNVTTPITGATVTVNVVVDGKAMPITVTCPAGGRGNVKTQGGTGQQQVIAAAPAPVVVRGGAGSAEVVTLPDTSAGSDKIVTLTAMVGSVLTAAGAYIVRMRNVAQF